MERDLSTNLASKKQELSRANDLLTSMRQYRGSLSDQEVLSLSPAAAKASALLKSGKSLTLIYSEHIQVSIGRCLHASLSRRFCVQPCMQVALMWPPVYTGLHTGEGGSNV